jgi:hypothetical protein
MIWKLYKMSKSNYIKIYNHIIIWYVKNKIIIWNYIKCKNEIMIWKIILNLNEIIIWKLYKMSKSNYIKC